MNFGEGESRFATGKVDSANEELQAQRLQVLQEHNYNILNDLLKRNSSTPVRVENVNLVYSSENPYRDSFLERQLRPLLHGNTQLTLQRFVANMDQVSENFIKTGTVTNIAMSVDRARNGTEAIPLNLVTNVYISSVKRLFMKIGTNIGNGEGDGFLTLQYKNLFGGGESVNFSTNIGSNSIGAASRTTYLLDLSAPVWNEPWLRGTVLGYNTSRTVDWTTKHDQRALGITFKLHTLNRIVNHELSYDTMMRTIRILPQATKVNNQMLFESGESFKSAVNYSVSYDTRPKNAALPAIGESAKVDIELSSPANVKISTELSKLVSWVGQVSSFTFKAGYIHTLASGRGIHFMDRFFIGGSNDVRGFALNSLGPKHMGLPIGGNMYLTGGVSNFSPLPFISKESNFKFHQFVNFGKLMNLPRDLPLDKRWEAFVKEPFAISCGLGLVYLHPAARFELNFAVPIQHSTIDVPRKGFQFGLGVSFL